MSSLKVIQNSRCKAALHRGRDMSPLYGLAICPAFLAAFWIGLSLYMVHDKLDRARDRSYDREREMRDRFNRIERELTEIKYTRK